MSTNINLIVSIPDLLKIDAERMMWSHLSLQASRFEWLRCEMKTYWKNSSDGILASRAESVRFLQTSTVTSLWNTQSPSLRPGVRPVARRKHSWVKVLWILMMSLSKLYSVDEWSFVLKVDKFYIEWKRLRRDAVVPRIWLNASTLLLEQGIVIIMIQTDRVTLTSCWPIRGRDDAILTN